MLKLKTKLSLGFLSILTIFIFTSVYFLYVLNQQNKGIDTIINEHFKNVQTAQKLKDNIQTMGRIIRNEMLHDTRESTIETIQQIHAENVELHEILDDESLEYENEKQLLYEIEGLLEEYYDVIMKTLTLINDGNNIAAIDFFITGNDVMREEIIKKLDVLVTIENEKMEKVSSKFNAESFHSTFQLIVILLSSCIFITIFIIIYIINTMNKSFRNILHIMTDVQNSKESKFPIIKKTKKDETGEIIKAYNKMAIALNEYKEKETKIQNELRNNHWIQEEISNISTILQGSVHIEDFGELFLSKICQSVKSVFGTLYIKDESDGYGKVASYANVKNDQQPKEYFSLGEGLVGQCAKDNQMILIDQVPKKYIKIQSGLGEMEPTNLMILPLRFEKTVIGVVELAKFTPFSDLEYKFLNYISDVIGVSINRILDHMKIEDLLSESQFLMEELQLQSEELQQQQEELQIVNEQLSEQNRIAKERAEQLENAKKELEERNRIIQLNSNYKSEFLANMSHELRTPLNSMLILSNILAENSQANLTETQVGYAQTIYSSGQDLLHLIDDILDLSKIESGRLEIFPEQIEIRDIINFVERQFTPISPEKNIKFQIIVDDDVPPSIFTDEQRLKQILNNLLANAFKFTIEGSVKLHLKKGVGQAKISFDVIDTGIGIEKEKFSKIFEDFYQEDSTTSRKFGGTGLGLPISRELTKLLQGLIKVESTKGKGSTFSIHLPDYDEIPNGSLLEVSHSVEQFSELEEGSIDVMQEDVHGMEELKNKVILIVDDDMRNVFALTTVFEKYQMETIFAENGFEALKILDSNMQIDMILMDIMMPEMDGYETMARIRKNDKYKDIPIIALTAKAMKNDRKKSLQAGASDYISKPVSVKQLLSLMMVWLHKQNNKD